MKYLMPVFAIIFCGSLLAFTPAEAKLLVYPEITMEAPSYCTVRKVDCPDGFTAMVLDPKPPAIMVLVCKYRFPVEDAMTASLSTMTSIPAKVWCLVDEKRDDPKGWAWRKDYAEFDGEKITYAILGHGRQGAFIIVLFADKNDYNKNQLAYALWRDSIAVK